MYFDNYEIYRLKAVKNKIQIFNVSSRFVHENKNNNIILTKKVYYFIAKDANKNNKLIEMFKKILNFFTIFLDNRIISD